MPSKKRVSPDQVETVACGNLMKKMKIVPKDPFEDRYAEMNLEIPNVSITDVMGKLFGPDVEYPCKYQVTSYHCEMSGVARTLCGETMFTEETKTCLALAYEKEKKQPLLDFLNTLFPCLFINHK